MMEDPDSTSSRDDVTTPSVSRMWAKPLSEIVSHPLLTRILKRGTTLVTILLYGVSVLAVAFVFLRASGVNVNPNAGLESMIDGSANRPFVYRTLLPTTAKYISELVPESVRGQLEADWRKSREAAEFQSLFRTDSSILLESLITFLLMVLALLGYVVILRYMSVVILNVNGPLSHLAPVLGLITLPPFFAFGYIYDFPVLFLFSWCMLLMFQRRWTLYFLVFTLSCFNKGTTVLLGVAYAAYTFDRLPLKRFLIIGGMQALIFLVVRAVLSVRFAGNPGRSIPDHLFEQVNALLVPYGYGTAFMCIALLLLLGYRWRTKPVFLKRVAWMFLPLAILFVIGGYPGEYRVFYEVLPIAVLMASHSLIALFRG